MATALKSRLSYHRRLFLLLLVFSWSLVACFVLFQYGREKHFKTEHLNGELQLFNMRLIDALEEGIPPERFITTHDEPFRELRVTLIDRSGRVLFDNTLDSLPTANHLDRPEVIDALAHGTGCRGASQSAGCGRH